MPDLKFSEKRRIGNIGEDLAEKFLVKRGYKIIERNYLKKFGELDIVASKQAVICFVEVKSIVSHENDIENVSRMVSRNSFTTNNFKINVSQETNNDEDCYLPEDNVNYHKQKRILRTIETYILERNFNDDQEWQIDIITVRIDFSHRKAIIKHIENVIFEAHR
jgi:putative endonuclease